jgi:hypothetical protein
MKARSLSLWTGARAWLEEHPLRLSDLKVRFFSDFSIRLSCQSPLIKCVSVVSSAAANFFKVRKPGSRMSRSRTNIPWMSDAAKQIGQGGFQLLCDSFDVYRRNVVHAVRYVGLVCPM